MKRTVGLVRLSDKLKGHFFHPNIIHVIVPWHSGVVGDGSWIDGNSEGDKMWAKAMLRLGVVTI